MGPAKSITISACLELSRRKSEEHSEAPQQIRQSRDSYQILSRYLIDLQHEQFYAMYLNRANHVLGVDRISSGGISGTVVDTRLICKPAIMQLASSVIVAHNHPSGNLKPSSADIEITKKLKEGLKLFDIKLLDHLIITDSGYLSFADEAML